MRSINEAGEDKKKLKLMRKNGRINLNLYVCTRATSPGLRLMQIECQKICAYNNVGLFNDHCPCFPLIFHSDYVPSRFPGVDFQIRGHPFLIPTHNLNIGSDYRSGSIDGAGPEKSPLALQRDSLAYGLSDKLDVHTHTYEMKSRTNLCVCHFNSEIELEAINLSLLYRLLNEFHKQLPIRTGIRVSRIQAHMATTTIIVTIMNDQQIEINSVELFFAHF